MKQGTDRHALAVRGNDLYETPREAVLALMAFGAKAHYGYRCDREGAKP